MAQIRPFRAIRYPHHEISNRIAPPYDVLDRADKQALLARSDRNIVAIDLPHLPPKQAGPPVAYERAASLLRQWLADGALKQDERPALYVYHQSFAHGGRTYTRRKFFARLRIEEFGGGSIYPHEQTFGGPKADRLMLTRATRCNLSPIFTLFPDESNDVAAAFEPAIMRAPDAVGTLDRIESRLWAVTDAAVIDRVCGLLADRSVFIADGHHRYGTAMMYRDELAKSQGTLSDDHPANFVLCVLAGMEDPGLLILPTHRVVCDLPDASSAALAEALADRFEIQPAPKSQRGAALVASLGARGPLAMTAFAAADDAAIILTPRDADMLKAYEPDRAPAWRRYGLAILHRYIFEEIIRPRFAGGRELTIHYVKSDNAAIDDARANRGLAFLPQGTTMAELRDICTSGELMPQKSTYFFPKIATGMVVNPLEA